MKNVNWDRVFNITLAYLMVASILVFFISQGVVLYSKVQHGNGVYSFEVPERKLTCVESWAGLTPSLNCLPTQWSEAKVSYEEEAEELKPTHDYTYPVCTPEIPPHEACWTKENGQLWPGYVLQ